MVVSGGIVSAVFMALWSLCFPSTYARTITQTVPCAWYALKQAEAKPVLSKSLKGHLVTNAC